MFGEIRHEESFRDVPTVPAGAIIQSDKQSIVYREKSAGVFEPVAIAYGKQKGERVPVFIWTIDHPEGLVLVDTGMIDSRPEVDD